jgi:hypothetical protein
VEKSGTGADIVEISVEKSGTETDIVKLSVERSGTEADIVELSIEKLGTRNKIVELSLKNQGLKLTLCLDRLKIERAGTDIDEFSNQFSMTNAQLCLLLIIQKEKMIFVSI